MINPFFVLELLEICMDVLFVKFCALVQIDIGEFRL